ncbi:DUF21 domain-containing protein, partial [uncultured Victivallis sp.]|uniref:DUF21 domain-containing protein n=1 Tax=uncultured Victivallis sp. TaxID=354118 RepID=UPI00258F47B7
MEDGSLLLLQLLFLGFLILLNAFFASSEVALISLKPATVRRLGTEGGRRGRRLADLVGNSGRFLATVQVGVTFAGFMASAFAADTFSEPVTDWLYGWGFQFFSKKILGGVIMVAITILLSYISLVFGELVPKQLGLRYAEAVALNVAGPIDFIARVTAPFVWFLNASVNFVLRLFGVTPGNSQEVTEEEIRMMVDIGEENGAIESDEKRMIENVFEFNNTTAADYKGYLPLQTLNKVFMYNSTGTKTYDNCWDFVAEGEHGLYMDIDSEIVGKNFLYMLTQDKYAAYLHTAYDALSDSEKAYFEPVIAEMEKDAADLGLGADGKYALAWIKLWVESYNAQTDDGPICNILVDKSAVDQFGLLVYSKLRSVQESDSVSVNNIKVAAYQDGYKGIGGYGYCHYLFVTDNSPLPWTACAFIAYMTCTEDGFSA